MFKNKSQQSIESTLFVNFLPRAIATLIDVLAILVVTYIIYFAVGKLPLDIGSLFADKVPFKEAWIVLFLVYDILMLSLWGATLGKLAMGIRVVKTDFKNMSFAQTVIRETVGKSISAILWLGFFWVTIDPRRQGWHDKIARTYVVKTKSQS